MVRRCNPLSAVPIRRTGVPLAAPSSPRGKTVPPAPSSRRRASGGDCRSPVSRLFTGGGEAIAVRVLLADARPGRLQDGFGTPPIARLRSRVDRNARPPRQSSRYGTALLQRDDDTSGRFRVVRSSNRDADWVTRSGSAGVQVGSRLSRSGCLAWRAAVAEIPFRRRNGRP